jgi:hypothetical protein
MADDGTYAPSNPSYTNFFAAVSSGNISNIDKSFTSSPNIAINALRHSGDGYEGMSALHIASSNGHVAMATFLLSIGADIDVRDRNISGSSTPLHYAAFNCHTEVITTLLDNGAAADSVGGFGGTALHQVLQNKVSVEERHIATITLLLDRGLDIDFGDVELGNTVVSRALNLTLRLTLTITAPPGGGLETHRSH